MAPRTASQASWPGELSDELPEGEAATQESPALIYAAFGFAPITALALSVLGLVPLHVGGPVLVGGALSSGLVLSVVSPSDRLCVLRGLAAGLIAVLIYDCTRLPFVVLGNWPDFIPKIGDWLLDRSGTHWSVGYAWRYLGNGAGMGLAFWAAAPSIARRVGCRWAGIAFGLSIWTGLIATLLVAPDGQGKLFALSPATVALSLIGHLVYGGVLGVLLAGQTSGENAIN